MTKIATALFALVAMSTVAMAADPVDAAKAKPYPLTTCIVSGEKLGEMGAPVVVVRDGQELKFCCKGCVKDFDKDPAKFLKKLAVSDDAGAKQGCCK